MGVPLVTAQTLTIPEDVSVECSGSIAPTVLASATASDGCSITDITYNDAENLTSCNNTGTIVRTWTATDNCGNELSEDQLITVVDTTPPSLVVPDDVVVDCGGSTDPEAETTGIATASDACGIGAIAATFQDDVTGLTGCSSTGIIVRTWRAVDDCGNVMTDTQNIEVQDNDPPTINCPESVSLGVNTDGDVPPADPASIVAIDGCDDNPTVTHAGDVLSSEDCLYTVERTYQAVDACGNTSTCVQNLYYTVGGPSVTAIPGTCNPANQSYDLDIEVTFGGTGTFNVILNGVSLSTNPYTYDADGVTNVMVNGLPANGFSGVTVEVDDPATCSGIAVYNAPDSCIETQYDGSISGTVFYDLNGNGTMDPGESGLSGIQVTLTPAGTGGGPTTPIVLYTDSNGDYEFGNLAPDDYTIVVGSGPTGYTITTSTTDSGPLTENESDEDNNFGFQPAELPPLESCEVPNITLCTAAVVPNEICLPVEYTGPDWFINDYSVLYDCSLEQTDDCIIYTALPGFEGNEFLVIQACNVDGTCINYCAEIVVGSCNEPPVAVEDAGTTDCGPITIAVLSNDFDPEDEAMVICSYNQPLNGSVMQSGEFLVYTPFPGYTGNDIFTYDVCDASGNMSTGTVTVAVNCENSMNNPPSVIDDIASTSCGEAVTIDALANDSDPDGDPLTICDNIQAFNGTVALVDGVFTYTPNAGYDGNDVFVYSACDTNGGETSGIVTINVEACTNENNPPLASDDTWECVSSPQALDVMANDSDIDGDEIYVCDFAQPASGFVTLENNVFTYTADPSFIGTVIFLYSVCDAAGESSTAIVTLTVCAENQNPIAVDDSGVSNGNPITIGVVTNDSDPEGTDLTICDYTVPDNGTVFPIDGAFVYTPNEGFVGNDSFTYVICDEDGGTATATVNVVVTSGECENITIYGCTAPIVALEICPSYCGIGPIYDITEVHNLYNCSIVIEEDCIFYTPLPGFYGQETLTITACNSDGICEEATAIITVVDDCQQPINMPPTVNDDVVSSACDMITIDPISNDSDPDNDVLTICSFTAPMYGSIQLAGNTFEYTPSSEYTGVDAFTYTVCDEADHQATATITVNASCGGNTGNNPPVAVEDQVTSNCTQTTIDVLANDSDPNGDQLSVCGSQQPINGTITLEGNIFTYTPNANFTGSDVFLYSVCDGNGGQTTGIVNVTVVCDGNLPPVAIDDNATSLCAAVAIDAIGNDGDPDGDAIFLCNFTQPSNGSVIQAGNSFIYSPTSAFNGTDSFEYTICDGNGGEDTAMVTITVVCENGNELPVAQDDTALSNCSAVTISPLTNDSDSDGGTLSICGLGTPTNGTVSQSGTSVVYTPTAGFVGTDSFTYQVCDGQGGQDEGTVTVTVTCDTGNESPVAVGDSVSAGCEMITINPLTNDTDPDNDVLNLCGLGTALNGTVAQVGNAVTYVANTGFNGTDSFTYTVCDGNGGQSTATVIVSVTCNDNSNTPPVAVNDTATSENCQSVTIDVIANDSDADGDALFICAIQQALNGSVVQAGTSLIYTPNAGFNGNDSFTYDVCDGQGGQSSASVTISVSCDNNGNLPPVAVDDSGSSNGNPITITPLPNDYDPDGDTITICGHGQASNGTVTQSGNNFIYTPVAGFTGSDSFTYTICDGNGGTDTGTVNVTVTGDTGCVPEVMNLCVESLTPTPICPDFCLLGGNAITIVEVNSLYQCGVDIDGGCVIYTSLPGFPEGALQQLTIEACTTDNSICESVTVNITIGGCTSNDPPNAVNDNYSTSQNTPVTNNVLANDSDPDGDTLTICNYTQASNGSVTVNGSNLVYTPNSGFTGVDSYTYSICDGNGNTSTATVTITVTGGNTGNNPPNAVNDSYTTTPGTAVTNLVLGNDSDPDGDSIYFCGFSQPSNGTVIQSGFGFIYTPNAGFTGADSYTYTICDGNGGSNTATVNITVSGGSTGNNPPNAVNDSYTTTPGSPVTNLVLGNDSDPDGDTLYFCGFSQASNGSVIQSGTGFIYTPNAGFTGADSYTYTICDGNGGSSTATVNITVSGGSTGNNPPNAVNDSYTTTPGNPVTNLVLGNDSDPDGDALYFCGFSQASNGSVVQSGTGFIYTPNAGFTGADSYTYTICDGNGGSSTATVNITVSGGSTGNNPPIAVNDSYTTTPGTPVTNLVLGNDTDPDGDALYFCGFGQGSNGLVIQSGTGFIYTPNSGFTGTDSYTYTICDGNGGSSTATVTINVSGGTSGNNPPNANDDDVISSGGSVTINVLNNDNDPDGDGVYICGFDQAANGTVIQSGFGFVYTPNSGFSGADVFSYTICDGNGGTDVAMVMINVNGGGNGCTNTPMYVCTEPLTPIQICPTSCGLGAGWTITNIASLYNCGIAISGQCVTYTPLPGFLGMENLTITMCNGGDCENMIANVNVATDCTAQNANPIAVDDSVNSASSGVTIQVLNNDSDPDGDALSICGFGNGANGTVTASGGALYYMPNAGFTGTDSFTYTVCDGHGGTDTAIVSVTVSGSGCQEAVNVCTGPITPIDICIDFCGLTGPVMINMASTTYNCSLGLPGGNCVSYTPLPGFTGNDTIEILACDMNGNCTTAYAHVFVGDCSGGGNNGGGNNGGGNNGGGNNGGGSGGTGGPEAPYAIPDVINTLTGVGVDINVLANDSDPNGDQISLCGNTNTVNGTISQSGNGYYYQPNAGFVGVDNFYYTLCDTNGNSSLAEVTIYVGTNGSNNGGGNTGNNSNPNVINDAVSTNVNTAVTVNVLSNDSDPNGDSISLCDFGSASNGTVYQSGSSLVYTPVSGFTGTDSFLYTACDTNGGSSVGTVTVTVLGNGGGNNGGGNTGGPCDEVSITTAYDYPTASIAQNTSYTYTSGCGSLQATEMVGPVNGTLTMLSDNSFSYVPNTGFVGIENLYFNSYTMVGTCGPYLCQVTALSITVTGNGDNGGGDNGGGDNGGGDNGGGDNGGGIVVANDDYYTTLNTNPATILILQNDVYPAGVQNLSITSQPSSGTAMTNSNGTMTYIPTPGFSGMVSFDYLLCVNGYCDPATVTISIEDNSLCDLGTSSTIISNGIEARGLLEVDQSALEECYAGGTLTLVIFNKDGKVIFDQEQKVNGFTGFDFGSLASDWGGEQTNTYYYAIEAIGDNAYKRDSGHIVLMR